MCVCEVPLGQVTSIDCKWKNSFSTEKSFQKEMTDWIRHCHGSQKNVHSLEPVSFIYGWHKTNIYLTWVTSPSISTTDGSRLIFYVPFSYFLFIFYLPQWTLPDFLLFLPWLPFHFHLVVIEQQQHILPLRLHLCRIVSALLGYANSPP